MRAYGASTHAESHTAVIPDSTRRGRSVCPSAGPKPAVWRTSGSYRSSSTFVGMSSCVSTTIASRQRRAARGETSGIGVTVRVSRGGRSAGRTVWMPWEQAVPAASAASAGAKRRSVMA
jgi:hypothetical protein